MNIVETDKEYVANTYARFPVQIVRGKGSLAWDDAGKEYIDLGSGIAVNTFGFADEVWQAAVTAQMKQFQHTSNLYYSAPCALLAEMLCNATGMKKVFFSNSGAEANECAIKAARKYAADTKGPDCYTIITLKNSFHGRTLTTLAATGQDVFHQYFQPLTPGFVYAEANNLEDVRQKVRENKVAAIMFEVIQGEGGVLPLTADFLHGLAEIAAEQDILLIADEVQAGNGRSGMLYAYMNYGLHPDIVTTAKGLGGGLPIGVTMLSEKPKNIFTPGLNGSTFGGNPICCVGAISILKRLDAPLMAEVKEKSALVRRTLEGAPGVKGISGMGLMLGVETEKPAGELAAKCIENGVLVLTAKNKLRLLPALNIPVEQLHTALKTIAKICAQ